MNTTIELHDSTVSEIANRNGTVIVHFVPAYLHKSEGRPGFDCGTGWVQDAQLIFAEGSFSGGCPDLPRNIMDGELMIGQELYANEVPVPLEFTGTAELRLVFDPRHAVTVKGQSARLQLLGEPRYVEKFEP